MFRNLVLFFYVWTLLPNIALGNQNNNEIDEYYLECTYDQFINGANSYSNEDIWGNKQYVKIVMDKKYTFSFALIQSEVNLLTDEIVLSKQKSGHSNLFGPGEFSANENVGETDILWTIYLENEKVDTSNLVEANLDRQNLVLSIWKMKKQGLQSKFVDIFYNCELIDNYDDWLLLMEIHFVRRGRYWADVKIKKELEELNSN